MFTTRWAFWLSLSSVLALAGFVQAETKVEVKGVHLCCGGCVKAVGEAIKKTGAKAACDKDAKTVTITAKDDKQAAEALAAMVAAGYHGETGNKDLAIKDDSGADKGKVKSLTLTGTHNCCGSCCKALKEAVKKVDGVKAETVKPKETTFTVTGNFDAADLIKALNAAGFHVKVKKE